MGNLYWLTGTHIGKKLSYFAKHMVGRNRFSENGTVGMDCDVVERPIALDRTVCGPLGAVSVLASADDTIKRVKKCRIVS